MHSETYSSHSANISTASIIMFPHRRRWKGPLPQRRTTARGLRIFGPWCDDNRAAPELCRPRLGRRSFKRGDSFRHRNLDIICQVTQDLVWPSSCLSERTNCRTNVAWLGRAPPMNSLALAPSVKLGSWSSTEHLIVNWVVILVSSGFWLNKRDYRRG